ncbi:hypothetical protein BGX26_007342 [Mortierella sp. AD094]|nr:hypothetical protein BGX26_007342 [Mortierella sp. AD094]
MFQFLLVSMVGSILAIYSRFGGEYANSIRWVRQGGYLEMYNTLVNSRENLSNKTKLILVVTILSSIAASIADVGAVYFIHPSSRPSNQSYELVNTTQFVPFDLQKAFNGWTSFVRNGDNITHAMASMINDTNRIPNAIQGRIYTPQTVEFNAGCDKMNFYAFNSSANFLLNQGGCATVNFNIFNSFAPSYDKATVVNKPNSRSSIKIPGTYYGTLLAEWLPGVDLTYGNMTCSLVGLEVTTVVLKGTNGITSAPKTWTTRCVLPTDEIVALSLTTIRFSISKSQNFRRISSSMFSDDAELVRAMEGSFKTATNKTIMFSELRFSNTTLEALVCLTANIGNAGPSAACAYVSVGIFITTQQEVNPTIAGARGSAPLGGSPTPADAILGYQTNPSIIMTIYHIPIVNNNSMQQLSIPEANNASVMSAQYFASLGQNIYLDWNTSNLFCWSTQYFLDPMYTGSLYKVMSIQMAPKSNGFAAMIRWSKGHSIECDGGFRTTPGDNCFYDVDLMSETSITRTL